MFTRIVFYSFFIFCFSAYSQQRIPQEFLPLQEIGKGSIKNPYWTEPVWKVWGLDPASVKIEAGELKGEHQPLEESKRLFPELIEKENGRFEFKLNNKEAGTTSGIWDDVYLSQDDYHTRLHPHKDQFLTAGKTKGFEQFDLRHKLGVNFTSQSYARRGRHIVDDFVSCLDVERNYFFANTVRCTPSHISFQDNKQEAVEDTYDALYSHSYQSIGQSGSEMHAIYKMMFAGGFIPREVKNKLKKHGLYAPAVLNLFKAALPYADAEGKALPFEHEMRHKVAYSSHGTPQHPHYCSANAHFHGYDDNLHLANMVKMAKEMKTTPPVTIMGLGGLAVILNGQQIKDPKELQQHLKMLTVTNLNIWGKPGEIIVARINLNKSFDLNNEKLSFTCKALYPNQKNIQIKEAAPGVFDIQIAHDPKLPKGRIPVIFTSQNESGLKGNPVFLNLYWPEEGEIGDHHHFAELDKRLEPEYKKRGMSKKKAMINKRPVIELPFQGNTIFAQPGETLKFPIKTSDLEGREILIYRRLNEVGKIENGEFHFSVPKEGFKSLYKVHLHCSDGTGGYTGRQIQIAVVNQKHQLEDGWLASCFLSSNASSDLTPGRITQNGSEFTISDQKISGNEFKALFISKEQKGPFDLTIQTEQIDKFGIQFSSGLDHYSSQSRLFFKQGKFHHYIRKDEAPWGIRTYKSNDELETGKIKYLRMLSDGKKVASYLSEDGVTWWQICGQDLPLFQYNAGILSYGNATTKFKVIESKDSPPMIVTKEKANHKNTYDRLTVSINSLNANTTIFYTTDGSEPTAESTKYAKEFEITEPGKYTLIAIAVFEGKVTGKTTAVFEVKK